MTQGRQTVFSVALFGFSEAEQRLLTRVSNLSKTRNPAFSLAEPASDEPHDILLVDADDTDAVAAWQAFGETSSGHGRAPTLMASRQGTANPPCFPARKPLIATRLLVALEAVATEALGFSAVLAIDPQDSLSPLGEVQNTRPEGSPAGDSSACTALVVDDSLPVRVQMDLALRPFASHVDFAETGERAFDLIK